MKLGTLAKRITEFGFVLLEHGFALDARAHAVTNNGKSLKSLCWERSDSNSIMIPALPKIGDYLSLIRHKEYSFIMRDGAIIQLAYQYDGPRLTRHRLLFWPCPFQISDFPRDLDVPLYDIVEYYSQMDAQNTAILRGFLRFDYAPNAQNLGHPASHLTIIDSNCRIPVYYPLNFDTLMRFLLENFYPDVWRSAVIRKLVRNITEHPTIRPEELNRVHLFWQP